MVTCIGSQYESNILTSGGFQKCITCLGSVHFQIWPLMTSHDLKWPRILKILTDSFLAWSQLSKNIRFIKSKKFHFSCLFSSTSSVGWNGPKPKFKKKNKKKKHYPSPSLLPQFSYINHQSSILNPRFLFSWGETILFALLISVQGKTRIYIVLCFREITYLTNHSQNIYRVDFAFWDISHSGTLFW